MNDVAVCDYGAGNTRSVLAAFARLGVTPVVSSDPERLEAAGQVVLPGVGSARAAMRHLERTGAATALRRRWEAQRPTLGVCLGMQLALEFTEEDGGVPTLSLLGGVVRRLESERVPRIGWSVVQPWEETFYFAHGFACDAPDTVATADGVCAVVESGAFLGVQFHPEKSGSAGLAFLAQWLSRG